MTRTTVETGKKGYLGTNGLGSLLAGALALALTGAAGCTGSPDEYLDGGTDLATSSGGDMAGHKGGDMGASGGLPCDVQDLLTKYCVSCHGHPPAGAPISIATYADLVATSQINPSQKVAERALARMQDTMRPMPPGPAPTVPSAAITAFQAWVTAGMKPGTCTPPPPDPFSLPPQCSSGKTWTKGNEGDQTMHPGKACITCHMTQTKAPKFQIAGTVYLTGHEPDDCMGSSTSDITVEITDAAGKVVPLTVNSSGNFMYSSRMATLQLPYHAKVKQNGKERAMQAAQMSGDCNSCHTQNGANGAPGRIALP